MTGYGRAEKTIDGREITVEMRAVNNRYLDLNVKLPRVYGFAEDAVKSLIKANVNRGKLDLFITVNVTADTSLQISLNKPVLEGYLAALKSIAADYGVRDDISVTALSRMPGRLRRGEAGGGRAEADGRYSVRRQRGAGEVQRHARKRGRGHGGRPPAAARRPFCPSSRRSRPEAPSRSRNTARG